MGSTSIRAIVIATIVLTAAACAVSPQQETAARLESATVPIGEEARSSTQSETTVAGDMSWATPTAMLAAMGAPVTIADVDGLTVESLSTTRFWDETRREVLEVSLVVSTELTRSELVCLIQDQPPIPAAPPEEPNRIPCEGEAPSGQLTILHGEPEAPLPANDDFFDWDAPVTIIADAEDSPGEPPIAVTVLRTRRQRQDAGDVLPHTSLGSPIRELMTLLPKMTPSVSVVGWTPSNPNAIGVNVAMTSLPDTEEETIAWMRTMAVPDSFSFFGETARATLSGEPPVAMSWMAGDYRNSGHVSFEYLLDEDGSPIATPEIATAPAWTELVTWGDAWSYDADGIEDDGWWQTGFDASSWETGAAPFGRDEPSTTDFPTPEPGMTGWLRRSFTIDDPFEIGRLDLEALVDDGMVVFINGIEVHRWNMPDGTLEATTLAVERISGDDELIVRRATDLATDVLVTGDNVIAIAVHQAAPDSSDVRFDLRLAATQRLY